MISPLQTPKSNAPRACRYPSVHSHGGVKRRSDAGFTLIEILVTISIIALLLGIGAVGMTQVQKAARAAQVKSMLEGLKGALTEYQTQVQYLPNHGDSGNITWSTVNGGDGSNYISSERFVYACSQVPAADKQLLAAVSSGSSSANERIFADKVGGNGINEIYDVWETPILYRSSNLGGEGNPDGTATPGLPLPTPQYSSKHPFFVSAGPDQEFGTEDDISTLEVD